MRSRPGSARKLLRDRSGAVVVDFAFALILFLAPIIFVLIEAVAAMLVYADSVRTVSKVADEVRRGNYIVVSEGAYRSRTNRDLVEEFCATKLFDMKDCTATVSLNGDSFPTFADLADDTASTAYPGTGLDEPLFDPTAPYVRVTFSFDVPWARVWPDVFGSLRTWTVSETIVVDLP